MADREKVIKGLEECNQYGSNCKVCPYYDPEDDGGCHSEELMSDALVLLKEQDDKIRQLNLALQIVNGNGIRVDTEGR